MRFEVFKASTAIVFSSGGGIRPPVIFVYSSATVKSATEVHVCPTPQCIRNFEIASVEDVCGNAEKTQKKTFR